MIKDTQASINEYLYSYITTDADMIAACLGTVRMFNVWATPDAQLPYLVYRNDFRSGDGDDLFAIRRGTMTLDIWSDSPNNDEILAIRKRLIELLDQLNFRTDEVVMDCMELQTEGFVPESAENIWHYSMLFNLRFYRLAETESIISRT